MPRTPEPQRPTARARDVTTTAHALTPLILLVGCAVMLTVVTRAALTRIGIPAIVGYLLIGLALNAADHAWHLLNAPSRAGFRFLAEAGLVTLLFRVGLQSEPAALLGQLRRAALIWIGDVAVSAGAGFVVARFVLEVRLVPALLVAAAFSATSLGVATSVWRARGALRSSSGALLLDLAELDDISGILLMILLFALAPVLRSAGEGGTVLPDVAAAAGGLFLKFAVFVALCVLLARFLTRRLTDWFARLDPRAGPMLFAAGTGFVLAAVADGLGFSLAIGAVFAGLTFSVNRRKRSINRAFDGLYRFFGPFFLIGVGLAVNMTVLTGGLVMGLVLLVAAIASKAIGVGVPAARLAGWGVGLVLGASMIPRAEIALIIMERGRSLGPDVVSPQLFAGMVAVTVGTCLAAPLLVGPLLRRYPQKPAG